MVEVHTFPCKFNQREETLPCLALTEIRLFKNEMDNLKKTVEKQGTQIDHEKKIVDELLTASDQEKKKKKEFTKSMITAVNTYLRE